VGVLLVSGSTRSGSTNTAALATAAELAPDQVTAVRYGGLASLPAFNPDDDGDRLPEAVADLRERIAAADAVLFCTPEYADGAAIELDPGGACRYCQGIVTAGRHGWVLVSWQREPW
jgi:NAD(P)H-dependent FMN reductase